MPKLKLMMCTRCLRQESEIPDVNPSTHPAEQGLATVHFDNRPPQDDETLGTIYVTPHDKDCHVLMRAYNEGC